MWILILSLLQAGFLTCEADFPTSTTIISSVNHLTANDHGKEILFSEEDSNEAKNDDKNLDSSLSTISSTEKSTLITEFTLSTMSDDVETIKTIVINELLGKSLPQRLFRKEPANCEGKKYGAECESTCYCPGNVCAQDGTCIYRNCNSKDRDGCNGRWNGWYFHNSEIYYLEGIVQDDGIDVSWSRYDDQFNWRVDWWVNNIWSSSITKENKFKINFKEIYLTLIIICVMLNPNNNHKPNPSCITLEACPKIVNFHAYWKGEEIYANWSMEGSQKLDNFTLTYEAISGYVCGRSNDQTWKENITGILQSYLPNAIPYVNYEVCVEAKIPYKNSKCSNKECLHLKALLPISSLSFKVEELKAEPSEKSIKLFWKIPKIWTQMCEFQDFIISLKDKSTRSWSKIPNPVIKKNYCENLNCSFEVPGLLPSTSYSYQLKANFPKSVPEIREVTTLEEYPTIPDNVRIVNETDNGTAIKYSSKELLKKYKNASCEILAFSSEVEQIDQRQYDCSSGLGTINKTDWKSGSQFNVTMKVCNTRGCKSSKGVLVWTHPKVPEIKENVTLIESTLEFISLRIPSFKNYSDGNIYILVTDDEPNNLRKEAGIEMVKRDSRNRTKRSETPERTEDYLSIVAILPLATEKYDLFKNFSDEDAAGEKEYYVACIYEIRAGPYKDFGATNFTGPFHFGNFSPNSYPWLTDTLIVLVALLIVSVLLFIVVLRSHRGLMFPMSGYFSRFHNNATIKVNVQQSSTGLVQEYENETFQGSIRENEPSSRGSSYTPPQFREHKLLEPAFELSRIQRRSSQSSVPESDMYVNFSSRLMWEELEVYLLKASRTSLLEEEFQSVPSFISGKSMQEGAKSENRMKNRYQNNLPYDDTLVVLPLINNDPSSNYINANLLQIEADEFGTLATYIATQGPVNPMMKKQDTVYDFWRMIWHENVEAIVMLTGLIENGQMKCAKYWPNDDVAMTMRQDISIILKDTEENDNFVIRKFIVTKDGEEKEVTQYQYLDWPDHDVPLMPAHLCLMIKLIRANHRCGPTVIHCSAGIGRTGTLMLVFMCLEELELQRCLDIKENFIRLRGVRPKLIQNVTQYKFVHCLLWAILFEDATSIPVLEFPEFWQHEQRNRNKNSDTNDLEQQFMNLKSFSEEITDGAAMKQRFRETYSRFQNVLPGDCRRVTLPCASGARDEQYLNAFRVDGFNKKDAYIVTIHPTHNTLERVWALVLERKITSWIILNDVYDDYDNFLSVIPTRSFCQLLEHITIELLESIEHENFQECIVRVSSHSQRHAGSAFECKVIQLHGWSGDNDLPQLGPDPLLDTLSYIHSQGTNSSPVLLTCLDGFTACGIFLALDIALQRIHILDEVNVYSACLSITYDRPQFIVSLEQYEFLHEAIANYLIRRDQDIYEIE